MDSPTEGIRMGMREVAVLIVIFFQSYFSVSFGGWEKFSLGWGLSWGIGRLGGRVGLVRGGG